jgi:hypothetical protein
MPLLFYIYARVWHINKTYARHMQAKFAYLSLVTAVTFEILSLWSYELHETMVPLLGTVLEIAFWNNLQ